MTKNLTSLFFAIGLLISINVWGQLPTAQEIARKKKVGMNLSNTLEAICGKRGIKV